jgi:4-amino-4-deoxy-L-arabinose transferase-like glycosyltransferase
VQVVLVLLVCVGVYWVRLGADGFFSSEGHRVLPAWAMLDSGDYLVPRLFGQVYVRKPPGIFWAIAASSELLGRTEFGARAVSATAMTLGSLLSLWFARRWFGGLDPMAGLVAGLGHALSPWFWQIGRVAEIEALHQLAVQASVFLLLDLMVGKGQRSRKGLAGLAVGAGLSMAAMGWIKGPAAAPCIGAALGAACIVTRSARPLLIPAIRGAFLVAVLVLVAAFGVWLRAIANIGGGAVSQSVNEFLWAADQLDEVALLLPTALGSALPVAFALLYPWGSVLDPRAPATNRIARAITWTCILSLGIYLAIGVSNRRYALPSFSFLAPLAAYAASRMASGVMVGVPWRIGHRFLLDRPAAWFVGMVMFAGVWLGIIEPRRAAQGGREPGLVIARAIATRDQGGTELWANDVIEARPDVLEYAAKDLADRGRVLRIRWTADAAPMELPPAGQYLAIRTDDRSKEQKMFLAHGFAELTELVCSGSVHEFTYAVYRVKPPG